MVGTAASMRPWTSSAAASAGSSRTRRSRADHPALVVGELDVSGRIDAAGLVPLFVSDGALHAVFTRGLDDLRAGYERQRMLRRGIPFRTDCYVVGDNLIWGATARMLTDLLERLDASTR